MFRSPSTLLLVLVARMASAAPQANPAGGDDSAAVPAAVVVRDLDGNTTVRATRIREAITLDGRLDESTYAEGLAISGFLQQEPAEGEPVTEKTDVWIFFNDANIYIAARCWDSHPEREVANEMRRDGQSINDNESFGVVFDTFHDRRNGFQFQVALAGGLQDGYITDERDMNRDWNTVWDARTARFDGGWTAEMAIPFKSLRYMPGADQTWGINFKRVVRWKNEQQYLTRIPAALGRRGMNKLSSGAILVGIEPPNTGRNFEVKPYGIGGFTTLSPADARSSTDLDRDAGVDFKVGVTRALTADITVNTDFAQVEEDEQQVNLTRFNVLFPEKREFFLEGQGIFAFGGVQSRPPRGGGGNNSGNPMPEDVPLLFFSRRIGLQNNLEVPLRAGGRVTGKAGSYSIGVLDIRTGGREAALASPTNFGVIRIKRDVLRRSAVGLIFTDRSVVQNGSGAGRAIGVDGLFSFYQNLNINTYIAASRTGEAKSSQSYRAQLDYNADRYGVQVEQLFVGTEFDPDIGFLRRHAFRRSTAYARFSPRPRSIARVRKFTYDVNYDYITNPQGRLESRQAQAAFRTEFQNGDQLALETTLNYERLEQPFEVSTGMFIPIGTYGFPEARFTYGFGPQRRATAMVSVERGAFYDGTRTGISTSRGRVEFTSRLSVEPGLTVNWVDLPQGSFTSTLVTARPSYTISPRMATSALVQYNSGTATFNTSVRFRWEYQPGSDLFVVYTDGRDTTVHGFPTLRSRGFAVKFTRLFRT